MAAFGLLQDLAIVLTVALIAGVVSLRLAQPVLVGYLAAGVLIGPHGLGLIGEEATVGRLGEIGVILLMFALGVEFSLAQCRSVRRVAFTGGLLYIALTIIGTTLVVMAGGHPVGVGLLVGFIVALSSTIIVARVLLEREAIDSVHGKTMLGWLILQDLAVAPLLVVIPFLADTAHSLEWPLLIALGKIFLFLGAMYLLGSRLFPALLHHVAAFRHKEIFILGVITLCFGTAALSAACGLSLALGAFLAGLVISQSDEHRQVLAEVLPLRDLFVTLFFVSIGMLIDPAFVAARAPILLGLVGLIMVGKACLGTAIASVLGLGLRTSLLIGLGLAQIGEFSFVLAREGHAVGLLHDEQFSLVLAAALLTMLFTPLLIRAAPWLAERAARFYHLRALDPVEPPRARPPSGHVILVGYGLEGEHLGRILHHEKMPFLVIDLDRRMLKRLAARGIQTLYGDAAMGEVLGHAGIATARLLVVTMPDPSAVRLIVEQALARQPDLEVIVSTHRHHDTAMLYDLGVKEVIRPEFEAGVALVRATLSRLGWPPHKIHHHLTSIRAERQPGQRGPDALDVQWLLEPPEDSQAMRLPLPFGDAVVVLGSPRQLAALTELLSKSNDTIQP